MVGVGFAGKSTLAKKQLEIPSPDEGVYIFTPETDSGEFINKLPG